MKQYIWFHPLYASDTSSNVLAGQIQNALNNHYIVLKENELYKVRAWDHLTLVGHSTSPKHSPNVEDGEDTGLYIQGETVGECIGRLQKAGLRVPPKILSLECCKAAIENGFAQKLSSHPFFENSLIESSNGSIGRHPGKIKWSYMPVDSFGRVLLHTKAFQWIFFYQGNVVAVHQHGDYKLQDILQTILPRDFHDSFFAYYKPGFFGGRVGRYCWSGDKINLEQATLFSEEDPDSATAAALERLMIEKSAPAM